MLYFISQFILAAFIVLTADWSLTNQVALSCSIPGVCLAIWAWITMGLTQIRVTPEPRGNLVTEGPYRWIRHPMYSGLLLFTLPLVCGDQWQWRLSAWIALAAVLIAKLHAEERLLRDKFSGYRDYQRRTHRLCPFIW